MRPSSRPCPSLAPSTPSVTASDQRAACARADIHVDIGALAFLSANLLCCSRGGRLGAGYRHCFALAGSGGHTLMRSFIRPCDRVRPAAGANCLLAVVHTNACTLQPRSPHAVLLDGWMDGWMGDGECLVFVHSRRPSSALFQRRKHGLVTVPSDPSPAGCTPVILRGGGGTKYTICVSTNEIEFRAIYHQSIYHQAVNQSNNQFGPPVNQSVGQPISPSISRSINRQTNKSLAIIVHRDSWSVVLGTLARQGRRTECKTNYFAPMS